ncbi:MAG: hypothetical protein CFE44_01245 [Burkholderiales bacterium PBB4]|nr:MAG: hypothetical protein CFE44_01245 [Burkholderiales bacterium PBB4]
MFEVLAYVYEHYFCEDSFLEPAVLTRKLNAVGFEPDEIGAAVVWLSELNTAARGSRGSAVTPPAERPEPWLKEPQPTSVRIYSAVEQRRLGAKGMGYLVFLESAGLISAPLREVVIDRVLAAPIGSVDMLGLKTILLMVFWSFGCAPGELLLDELCEDNSDRLAH